MRQVVFIIFLLITVTASAAVNDYRNQVLLEKNYDIYVDEQRFIVSNQPFPDAKHHTLPTTNSFEGIPGCYIACYGQHQGIYRIAKNIYTHGLVRVPGTYQAQGHDCLPQGDENQDISQLQLYLDLCKANIPSCDDEHECWAGGDTGGFI